VNNFGAASAPAASHPREVLDFGGGPVDYLRNRFAGSRATRDRSGAMDDRHCPAFFAARSNA